MKNLLVFFSIALAIVIGACKESTVLPDDGDEVAKEKTQLLTEQYWIVVSTTDPANNEPSITKFKSDGSATVRFFEDSQTKSMNWKFNSTCDSLELINQYQTVSYHIAELSNSKLKLSKIKSGDTSIVEFCRVDKDYLYAVGGKIQTSLLTGLTNEMSLAAAWHSNDSLGNYMKLNGRGKINISEKIFYIGFENTLPDDACVLAFYQNPVDYKLAFGYIMLFEHELSDSRYANFLSKIELQNNGCVGVVEDRCIAMLYNSSYGSVYLKGDQAAWINDLPNGWCMTELTPPNGTIVKNYWKETYPYDLVLNVGNIKNYTFPVWD